jgi:N-acetylmuramoyl-L-alanine amidase
MIAMADADAIVPLEASHLDAAARTVKLGYGGTSGPELYFSTDGIYIDADHQPAHPGRIGGAIDPFLLVIHTTDMLPDEHAALVSAWTSKPADGACAHFLIGRDESQGLIQFVPVNRNGNHVGGKTPPNGHGWVVVDGKNVHPNLVTIGVEIHNAGGVQLINGAWRLVEDGKAHGAPIPNVDVTPDPKRPGRGWHNVTPYQLATLTKLAAAIVGHMRPMPAGAHTISTGEAVPGWATPPTSLPICGHVDLDPTNRSDPWPPLMLFLRGMTIPT